MQNDFQIIPAIDIKDGALARSKGLTDPLKLAQQFEQQGAQYLHVVDLNGAVQGKAKNFPLIRQIGEQSCCKIEISAGIETEKDLKNALDLNPWQIILSSKLLFDFPGLTKLIRGESKEKITISVDHNNGMLASRGWRETSDIALTEIIPDLKRTGIKRYIVTDVRKDGSMEGADIYEALRLKNTLKAQILVSGGIQSIAEIQSIKNNGLDGVILGTALMRDNITIEQLNIMAT